MNKLNKNQIATVIRNTAFDYISQFDTNTIVEADWLEICSNLGEACALALLGEPQEDPKVLERQQIVSLLDTLRATEVKTVTQLNLERDAMVALGKVADVKPQTVAAAWKRCIKAVAKANSETPVTSEGSLSEGMADVRSGRVRRMDPSELEDKDDDRRVEVI